MMALRERSRREGATHMKPNHAPWPRSNEAINHRLIPNSLLACAGDNALDYVIEGAKVSAVDFNPCQIALCELKVRTVGRTRVRGVQNKRRSTLSASSIQNNSRRRESYSYLHGRLFRSQKPARLHSIAHILLPCFKYI